MRKPYWIVGGTLGLILLLAAAAFVGGRLSRGQGLGSPHQESGPSLGKNGGAGQEFDFEPAEELPQVPADVAGLFDHRQDNSLFVGTGQATVSVGPDGVESSSDGPTIEVVVTSQTVIYKDVTSRQFDGEPKPGETLRQTLEPGSLEEIGQASQILAWGKKTGDRLIADILVYSPPGFITE